MGGPDEDIATDKLRLSRAQLDEIRGGDPSGEAGDANAATMVIPPEVRAQALAAAARVSQRGPVDMPTEIGRLPTGLELGQRLGTEAERERWTGKADGVLAVIERPSDDDDASRRRFESAREAEAALDHPNILGVLATGEADGRAALARPAVRGARLSDLIADGSPVPTIHAVEILSKLAEALDHAHGAGAHVDATPDHVLITEDGEVKLFGFARALGGESLQSLANLLCSMLGDLSNVDPKIRGLLIDMSNPAIDLESLVLSTRRIHGDLTPVETLADWLQRRCPSPTAPEAGGAFVAGGATPAPSASSSGRPAPVVAPSSRARRPVSAGRVQPRRPPSAAAPQRRAPDPRATTVAAELPVTPSRTPPPRRRPVSGLRPPPAPPSRRPPGRTWETDVIEREEPTILPDRETPAPVAAAAPTPPDARRSRVRTRGLGDAPVIEAVIDDEDEATPPPGAPASGWSPAGAPAPRPSHWGAPTPAAPAASWDPPRRGSAWQERPGVPARPSPVVASVPPAPPPGPPPGAPRPPIAPHRPPPAAGEPKGGFADEVHGMLSDLFDE
jgi:hypothetical protein